MAINYHSDIEDIKNNFARLRTNEAYSQPIVTAELNAKKLEHQAALANLAGCQSMSCSATFIGQASNNSALLKLASAFNELFSPSVVVASKDSPTR